MNDDTRAVNPQPIPTEYAGHQFRSRLEARWAVFFDAMGIPWQYEAEGYQLASGWYVPDFYLPHCATFCEVRGDIDRVDLAHLREVAAQLPALPRKGGELGPRLMLLGPMPTYVPSVGDLGWLSMYPDDWTNHELGPTYAWCGFGDYHKNKRPWWLEGDMKDPACPLEPIHDEWECDYALNAYRVAASRRFWNPK